jgi:hypothetical protein
LIEALVASALLALLIVPLVDMAIGLARQTGMARSRVVARSLAAAALERFRGEPADVLVRELATDAAGAAAIERDDLLALPPGAVGELVRRMGMTRSLRAERTAGPHVVLVSSVRWPEDGHERTLVLKCLVAGAEIHDGGDVYP